jgi:putative tricarboxylic transport membrane protein
MQKAEKLCGVIIVFIGLIFGTQAWSIVYNSKQYGEGWFPFLASIIIIGCGIFNLLKSRKIEKHVPLNIDYWFLGVVIIGAIIYCLLILLIGFTLATFVYLIAMFKSLGKTWKYSLVLSFSFSVGVYIIFVRFLTIYFPSGYLFELAEMLL